MEEFITNGECSECHARVSVTTINNSKEIELRIKLGTKNVLHNKKKRFVDGNLMDVVNVQLDKKQSTYNIVNDMAVEFANINTMVLHHSCRHLNKLPIINIRKA